MITAADQRAQKRVPMAKQALTRLESTGLNEKSGVTDGFGWKVWRNKNKALSGGRVSSTAGIFIMLSSGGRQKQFVCDSFSCLASPMFATADGGRKYLAPNPLPTNLEGIKSAVGNVTPELSQTVLGKPLTGYIGSGSACVPFGGEYVLMHTALAHSDDGVYHTLDAGLVQITHCLSNGAGVGTLGVNQFAGKLNRPLLSPPVVVPLWPSPGYGEYVIWWPKWQMGTLNGSDVDFYLATYYYFFAAGEVYGAIPITARGLYPAAPQEYWDIVTRQFSATPATTSNHAHLMQAGAYFTRQNTTVKGVIALGTSIARSGLDICGAAHNTPCVTAAAEEYALTLSFVDLVGATTTLTYSGLKDVIYGLANGELAYMKEAASLSLDLANAETTDVGRKMAIAILFALFGPGASEQYVGETLWRNAATFASNDGTVYSWLRSTDPAATQIGLPLTYTGTRNGGFKFDAVTGITRVALTTPAVVLSDTATWPIITRLTATDYLCVVRKTNGLIAGTFVGSPFGSWIEIAPPVGVTMTAIRPTQTAAPSSAGGFIGIGKLSDGTYRVYLKIAGEAWAALSPVQVGAIDDATSHWDICVLGDEPLTKTSLDINQHTIAYVG